MFFLQQACFPKKNQSIINKDLTKKTTPNFAEGCASLLQMCCIVFIPELLRIFEIFSTFAKREGVYKLIYKSCCKEICISIIILILLLVLSTRCFLQISIIIHTDRDRSHFLRESIFAKGMICNDHIAYSRCRPAGAVSSSPSR